MQKIIFKYSLSTTYIIVPAIAVPAVQMEDVIAKEMGYPTWDKMIDICCSSNTPQVIHKAEQLLNKPDTFLQESMKYIGTYQLLGGKYVWHLFEVFNSPSSH